MAQNELEIMAPAGSFDCLPIPLQHMDLHWQRRMHGVHRCECERDLKKEGRNGLL